jgi:muramoyltetrapeptide carboxypeptidase
VASAYLFCPAYGLDDTSHARARAGLAPWADALGLTIVPSPLLTRRCGPGAWLAADERRADLAAASRHDWIVAARGGYGCIELLPAPAPPGRLVGYSDLTILHAAWDRPGLYGFMPGVPHGPRALASAIAAARQETLTIPGTALRPGRAEGRLFAACLRVLTGLTGTPWLPRLAGRILAIEDIDEKPYQIDRDLWQLYYAGALNGLAGLVTGCFPCPLADGYAGPSVTALLTAWAERLGVPAIGGVPFGHDPDPWTLPHGAEATLTVTAGHGTLICQS